MENRRVWDWKSGSSISQNDLNTSIIVIERDINTLNSAIKDCKRSEISDHLIDLVSAKVKLSKMENELSYLKALSHETV